MVRIFIVVVFRRSSVWQLGFYMSRGGECVLEGICVGLVIGVGEREVGGVGMGV